MGKVKKTDKKKELITQLINVALAMIGAIVAILIVGKFWDAFYANFDDLIIKDIISGAFTGNPDKHAYFILYPLSSILTLLYKIIPAVPWFGVLLCGINIATVYFITNRILNYTQRLSFKLVTVVLVIIVMGAALLRYSVFFDFRVSGGLAIATAIYAFITFKDTSGIAEFLIRSVPSFILMFLGFNLNARAFLVSLPLLIIACAIKIANGALKKKAKKSNKDSLLIILISNDSIFKYLTFPVLTALMVVICILIHTNAYKSEEWKNFKTFYEDAETVFEIQENIPEYSIFRDMYDLYGIDEYRYTLLEDKNYALIDSFDPELLGQLKEINANNYEIPYKVTYSDAVNMYFEGIDFFNFGFLTLGLLILYAVLLVSAIITEKKRFVFWGMCIFFARNLCGLWAYMSGLHVDSTVISLTIIESFVIIGNIVILIPYLIRVKKNGSQTKKIIALVTRAVLIVICLGCIWPLVVNVKRINREYDEFVGKNETWQALEDYIRSNPDIMYICDTRSVDYHTDKVFKRYGDNVVRNFITAGGFVSQMPAYKETLANYQLDSLTDVLLEENVYWVTENTNYISWLENYYQTRGQNIDATEKEELKSTIDTKFIVYSVVPYVFGEEFLAGGYDSFFLSQYSAKSFAIDKFELFLGCHMYSTDETQSFRKIAKMAKTALSVKPDMANVWILIDPFNYDFTDESLLTTDEINSLEKTVLENSGVAFYFMFNFPSANEWNENPEILDLKLESYKKIYNSLSTYANAYFALPGSNEWILKNPSINNGETIDPKVSEELIGGWIAGYYNTDAENIDSKLDEIKSVCEECRNTTYPDLSGKKVVYFGDSIIANYQSESGIAACVNTLSGIDYVSNAVGGTSATADFGNATSEYFAGNPDKASVYVINYGFNDYLQCLSVEGYKNGLKTGISNIKAADPDAKIIIVSPYFSDGTSVASNDGPKMPEYVKGCEEVAGETGCYFINNFDELAINEENVSKYQELDHVHLNQEGRIKYSEILVRHLGEWLAD